MMKKLRCKKEFGLWFYNKVNADDFNGLDAPIYELYNTEGKHVENFGSYGDLKYFIETGEYL